AAARVRTLSVERLADGLDDRFRLLTGGARTALARQQTLLASVGWSHDLLDEPERMLFRRLGVFAAPFDVEAVEAVAADDQLDPLEVVDLLSRLVDKNMVQPAGDRYRLLETLRHYALERAADAGELAELRSRHLAWFRRRAAAWGVDREVTTFPVLEEIAAEAPDLLAALEWSLGPGRRPAADLLYALAWYWGRRFAHEELRAVSAQVLAALDEGSAPWLEALAPVADELYFATELGWVPAARRALDTLSGEIAPAVRGLVEHALSLGPAFLGLLEGVAGLERAAEARRSRDEPSPRRSATSRRAPSPPPCPGCAPWCRSSRAASTTPCGRSRRNPRRGRWGPRRSGSAAWGPRSPCRSALPVAPRCCSTRRSRVLPVRCCTTSRGSSTCCAPISRADARTCARRRPALTRRWISPRSMSSGSSRWTRSRPSRSWRRTSATT